MALGFSIGVPGLILATNLKWVGIVALTLGSGLAGFILAGLPTDQPTAGHEARYYSEHHLCDLNSDEVVDALAEALSGKPQSTRRFLELSAGCGDDVRMFQLAEALELAFPRATTAPGAAASNLVMSTSLKSSGPQEANRLAFALALLAFKARTCGSREMVLERLGALGFKNMKLSSALAEFEVRSGGGVEQCGLRADAD